MEQMAWNKETAISFPQMKWGHINLFLQEGLMMTCFLWNGGHKSHCLLGSQMHLWPSVPFAEGFRRCLGIVTVWTAKGGNWLRQVSAFARPESLNVTPCQSEIVAGLPWIWRRAWPSQTSRGGPLNTAAASLRGAFAHAGKRCPAPAPPHPAPAQMQLQAWQVGPRMDCNLSLSQLCSLVLWTNCATIHSHPDFENH